MLVSRGLPRGCGGCFCFTSRDDQSGLSEKVTWEFGSLTEAAWPSGGDVSGFGVLRGVVRLGCGAVRLEMCSHPRAPGEAWSRPHLWAGTATPCSWSPLTRSSSLQGVQAQKQHHLQQQRHGVLPRVPQLPVPARQVQRLGERLHCHAQHPGPGEAVCPRLCPSHRPHSPSPPVTGQALVAGLCSWGQTLSPVSCPGTAPSLWFRGTGQNRCLSLVNLQI